MKYRELLRGFPIFSLVFAGVLIVGAIGCGGSGGSDGQTATASTNTTGTTGSSGGAGNPYAGTYAGEFIDQDNFIGTVTATVSSSGVVNGTYNYPTPVSFSGTVNNSGAGSITDSKGTFQVTLGASGRTTLGGGVGTPTNGAFVTLDAFPSSSFGGINFYAGTVHNTTIGATGIIAFSVDATGVVSGVDLFDVNGKPTLEPISGSLNASGVLTYTVDGVTVAGNVSDTAAAINGNLQESNGASAVLAVSRNEP